MFGLTLDDDEDAEGREEEGAHKEGQEGVVVADSDAVVDPGAVMVEALHTHVADRTVPRTSGPDDQAVWAEIGRGKALQKIKEVDVGSWVQDPGVSSACESVRDCNNESKEA